MCLEMKHRGPDDMGFYISGTGTGLGAVRLSIIDLAGGHQPLSNEEGDLWVVMNGEIYNFLFLRRLLVERGHVFTTFCDTEVVVHAYEEWGEDCVVHLDGMFAFAIWDNNHRCLFMARDRLGKKPLYYYQDNQVFIFSSEIKSLLKYQIRQPNLDREAIDMFLTLAYIPGSKTVYEGVNKVPAGNSLVVDEKGRLEFRQYWDLPQVPPNAPHIEKEKDVVPELCHLLEEAVKSRLLADVPLGVFLSGGLDSSIVTALMIKHKLGQLKSFSVRFTEPEHNEAPLAHEVANFLGTDHYELTANHCPPDLLRKLVWHCDEPLADPAIVPTYLVSSLAREQVTVVLTGEGADELFAGYFYHPLEKKAATYDWMPAWAKRQILANGARLINGILDRQRYHPRTVWSWQLRPEERMLAWMAIFTDAEKRRWFTRSANDIAEIGPSARYLDAVAQRHIKGDWLSNFSYIDLKVPLVDDLLMKVDKMSMASSLEARCPYLDHHFVEYASKLSQSLKLNRSGNKVILRKVAMKLLPERIINRVKHGFDVPLKRWLTEDLNEYFWDMVMSRNFGDLQIINQPQIEEIWSEMVNDVPSRTRQIWSLLILATWLNLSNS